METETTVCSAPPAKRVTCQKYKPGGGTFFLAINTFDFRLILKGWPSQENNRITRPILSFSFFRHNIDLHPIDGTLMCHRGKRQFWQGCGPQNLRHFLKKNFGSHWILWFLRGLKKANENCDDVVLGWFVMMWITNCLFSIVFILLIFKNHDSMINNSISGTSSSDRLHSNLSWAGSVRAPCLRFSGGSCM